MGLYQDFSVSAGDTPSQSKWDTLGVNDSVFQDGTEVGNVAWTSYTPTVVNLTLGNGSVDCKYSQRGTKLKVRGRIVFGSSTSVSGTIIVPLPAGFTVAVDQLEYDPVGTVSGIDAGAGVCTGKTLYNGSSELQFTNNCDITTDYHEWDATYPFTWGTGDSLNFEATIEIEPI